MSSSLATYLGIVRARWRWLMWGVLLALAATTVALLAEPPQYRTTASVFVRTPGDVTTVLDGGDSYAQGRARTYAALVDNTSLSATVIADLGLDLEPEDLARRIHGTSRPGTVVIDITVSAPTRNRHNRWPPCCWLNTPRRSATWNPFQRLWFRALNWSSSTHRGSPSE